jgi:hypothetical protein
VIITRIELVYERQLGGSGAGMLIRCDGITGMPSHAALGFAIAKSERQMQRFTLPERKGLNN